MVAQKEKRLCRSLDGRAEDEATAVTARRARAKEEGHAHGHGCYPDRRIPSPSLGLQWVAANVAISVTKFQFPLRTLGQAVLVINVSGLV
jgi:hypothetical protein